MMLLLPVQEAAVNKHAPHTNDPFTVYSCSLSPRSLPVDSNHTPHQEYHAASSVDTSSSRPSVRFHYPWFACNSFALRSSITLAGRAMRNILAANVFGSVWSWYFESILVRVFYN